jgi:hypothetical protein
VLSIDARERLRDQVGADIEPIGQEIIELELIPAGRAAGRALTLGSIIDAQPAFLERRTDYCGRAAVTPTLAEVATSCNEFADVLSFCCGGKFLGESRSRKAASRRDSAAWPGCLKATVIRVVPNRLSRKNCRG